MAQGRGRKEEEPPKLPRFPSWEKQNPGIAVEQGVNLALNGGRDGDREKVFLYLIDFHPF